jgi:protein arginine kinase
VSTWEALVASPCGWLAAEPPNGGIVLSSRIRLARNLAGRSFPQRARAAQRAQLLADILQRTQSLASLGSGLRLQLDRLERVQRQFLGERQLVSQDLLDAPEDRGVVIGADQTLSFLINEEDHLRIQAIRGGLDLDTAYRAADGLETELETRLEFAFSERLGFLTACPTNIGTGMRASVLIHLPGIVLDKEMDKLFESLREQHLTIRGFYGEGSAAMGNFFQISNATTLGVGEPDLIDKLDRASRELVAWEERARAAVLSRARSLLEDRIWRSFGILRHARVLTAAETLNHGSLLRLGVGLGLLSIPLRSLNEILIHAQPAHAQLLGGGGEPSERDAWRAHMVRNELQRCET